MNSTSDCYIFALCQVAFWQQGCSRDKAHRSQLHHTSLLERGKQTADKQTNKGTRGARQQSALKNYVRARGQGGIGKAEATLGRTLSKGLAEEEVAEPRPN